MNPGLIQLIIICIYMGLLLVLGVFANRLFRGTKEDYLLASHSIGPFLLLMSLFGTTMTAFALVGSSGEAYKEGIGVYGMLASSSGIIHSLCFFVIGIKLWSLGRRYGYTTQIEFFRDRLDSDLHRLAAVSDSGRAGDPLPAARRDRRRDRDPDHDDRRISRTVSFAQRSGTQRRRSPWLGSLVVCCVVLIYVFFGGMRGTAWANTFQTIVFMVLGVVTFVVIANKLGGQDSFLENLRAASQRVSREKITRVEMSQSHFFTYMLIPFSVGMFPHLFQHWLTAKSAKAFKIPVICHPIFIMIVWVPCVLIGIWASAVELPPKIAANPNAVLPFLVNTRTGPVLGGLLAAGILAAIMSSLDSQFLCLGTIFSNDIVGHYLGRDRFTDKQQVILARVFIVAIVAFTYYLSLQGNRSVFTMGEWCFTGFASLFPLIFAALYWKRLTLAGAIAGILAMISAWLYLFRQADYGRNADFFWEFLGYELRPVVPIFGCALVAIVAVSLVTRAPKEATIRRHFGTF